MKYLFKICLCLIWFTSESFAAGFIDEIDDLPLMEGFQIIEEDTISFDKPEGRIVIVTASSPNKGADPLAFYAETLPQLGWVKLSQERYKRDNEELEITANKDATRITLKFFLSPMMQN